MPDDLQLTAEELIAEHTGRGHYARVTDSLGVSTAFWSELVPGPTPGSQERRLTSEARRLGITHNTTCLSLKYAVDEEVTAELYDDDLATFRRTRAEAFTEAVNFGSTLHPDLIRDRITTLRLWLRARMVAKGILP